MCQGVSHPALHPLGWAPWTWQNKSEFITNWFRLTPSCDPPCGRLPVSPAGQEPVPLRGLVVRADTGVLVRGAVWTVFISRFWGDTWKWVCLVTCWWRFTPVSSVSSGRAHGPVALFLVRAHRPGRSGGTGWHLPGPGCAVSGGSEVAASRARLPSARPLAKCVQISGPFLRLARSRRSQGTPCVRPVVSPRLRATAAGFPS